MFFNQSMIVGLDSTLIPGRGQKNYVMTSSLDEYCSRYFTSIMQGNPLEGNIAPAASLILNALTKFQRARNMLPDFIFVYRSGSSDKEKELILRYETQKLVEAVSSFAPNYNPKVCFIVVNKKTEMKFFEGTKNPQPGTVVDLACVNPFIYEFYIQPQYVNQGTATPTNFHVIYDTIKVPCEILQELTYQLCYYYFNWGGPIRVPAPLKYAEVCNKFITTNLDAPVDNERLQERPFYI